MKTRFLSLTVAVWLACCLTMTACSALEVPPAAGGTEGAALTSAAQDTTVFTDVPAAKGKQGNQTIYRRNSNAGYE